MIFLFDMTDIRVIFENNDVLVIDKPSGLLVHGDGIVESPTVVEWFVSRVPTAAGVGEPSQGRTGEAIDRSGVVHRLDAETSGVLVLAKTQEAFVHLKAQFHDRYAKKEYRAFVYGSMHEKWGTIDRPIGRSARDFRLRSAQRGAKGTLRAAVTDWELVRTGVFEGESFSELILRPKTGRTHQLRVHLKAIDRPIVCDRQYAASRPEASNNLGFSRLALHARELALALLDGSEQRFVAELPQEFLEAADRIAPR